MKNFKDLYSNEYFVSRNYNDKKRLKSFILEKEFLLRHVSLDGVVCDVGCSTGEFLSAIQWEGDKYGMEISDYAQSQAELNGINFEKNILTELNFFDVVIFRGTIQHLPEPFDYISKAFTSLKSGGKIIFLATPNANSIVYKITNTLPVLYPHLNFWIPSDLTLQNVCKNFGFSLIEIEKPYLNSPYSNFLCDHIRFIGVLFFRMKPKFPFWGNMMNMILEKPF